MKNLHKKDVWVRIAGNAENIKTSRTHHWRAFIDRTGDEIPLLNWRISGRSSPMNVVPGTATDKDHNGLHAWIDFFGNISIDNNTATIELTGLPHLP